MNVYRTLCMTLLCLSAAALVSPVVALAEDSALQFRTVTGVGGVPLNVVTAGDPANPAIVLVHGIGQSYVSFENQLNSTLKDRYFLVAFDLRGHGSSGKPWLAQPYSQRATWAGDLASVVRALKLKRPVLFGWSYGTLVVVDYLRLHGTRDVAGVVMSGAYGGLNKPPATTAPPAPEFVKLREDLASADLDRKWAASRAMARYLTARPMSEAWTERATALGLLLPQSARAGMMAHAFDNTDLIPRLQTLPMLFVIGGKDFGSPESMGQQLVGQLPRARLLMHPEDGHSPFVESPQQFNRELVDFVGSLPALR